MYGSYGYYVSSVFLVEGVKIRNVLEVVCIYGAVLNYGVGYYIVVVFLYYERDSLGSEYLCSLFEYLCVRCGRCGNGYGGAL